MTHFRLYHNLNTKCRFKTLYRVRWTNFRKTLSFKSLLDRFNFKRYGPNNAGVLKYDTPRTSAILVTTDPQYPTVRFFKHICHQLLSNRYIPNLRFHQWPLRQYWTNNVSLHNTFLPFRNRPSKPVILNQRLYSNVVLAEEKNAVRRSSTF